MPPDLPPRLADDLRDVGAALTTLRQILGDVELLDLRDNPPPGRDLADQLRSRECPYTDFELVACACPEARDGIYDDPCTIELTCPWCRQRRRAAPTSITQLTPTTATEARPALEQRRIALDPSGFEDDGQHCGH